MNKNIIIAAIIVLVLVGGYFLFKARNQVLISQTNDQQPFGDAQGEKQNNLSDENQTVEQTGENSASHKVIYTDSGYSPKEITIKIGDTVKWENQSSHGMWTSSAMHPTHIIYGGTSLEEHCPDVNNTSFDQCASGQPGQSWFFKFDKQGVWRYHNHVQASDFGSVIVE